MSDVLTNYFILCEHGTKGNIGGSKIANTHLAVNMDFFKS